MDHVSRICGFWILDSGFPLVVVVHVWSGLGEGGFPLGVVVGMWDGLGEGIRAQAHEQLPAMPRPAISK